MIDRIIYGALAFNIFYGLLSAIMLQSLSGKYPVADNKYESQNENNSIRGVGENRAQEFLFEVELVISHGWCCLSNADLSPIWVV